MIDSKWLVTLLIVFMIGLVSFTLFTLLGVFVEGTLNVSQGTRGVIVGIWGFFNIVSTVFTLVARHTDF